MSYASMVFGGAGKITSSGIMFIGAGACASLTGLYNVVVGAGAGASLTTGTYNTLIGAGSDAGASTVGATAVGAGAKVTITGTAPSIAIGYAAVTAYADTFLVGRPADHVMQVDSAPRFVTHYNPIITWGPPGVTIYFTDGLHVITYTGGYTLTPPTASTIQSNHLRDGMVGNFWRLKFLQQGSSSYYTTMSQTTGVTMHGRDVDLDDGFTIYGGETAILYARMTTTGGTPAVDVWC